MTPLQGVVIFFPGDQLEHALAAPDIRRLQDPKIQAQLMAAKFQDCSSVVYAYSVQPHLHIHILQILKLICLPCQSHAIAP